jgi:hypothetical protein
MTAPENRFDFEPWIKIGTLAVEVEPGVVPSRRSERALPSVAAKHEGEAVNI